MPMPKYWYSMRDCVNNNPSDEMIVADKKPYFMIYIYPNEKNKYKNYEYNTRFNCRKKFDKEIEDLDLLNDDERLFYYNYHKYMPVSIANSTMNKICRHIEGEFSKYTINLKQTNDFDYSFMKTNRKCFKVHREQIERIYKEYSKKIQDFQKRSKYAREDKETYSKGKMMLNEEFRSMCQSVCTNDDEMLDIVLDLCYKSDKSKSFCWDVVGDLIIKNLELESESEK